MGLRFNRRFLVRRVSLSQLVEGLRSEPNVTAHGFKLLLVEDDDSLRESMEEALVLEGYDVRVAREGHQALCRLAGGFRPQVIVMDLLMPGLDGAALCARLRRDVELADVPIVAVSGSRPDRSLEAALDGFLEKPVELETLLVTIAHFCVHRPALRGIDSAA